MSSRGPRPAWGWLLVAGLTGAALWALTQLQSGVCLDSPDPALSSCESGPVLGVGGTAAAGIAWALFAWWCVQRALRPLRRSRRRQRAPRDTTPAADGSTSRIGAHTAVELPMPGRGGVRLAYAPSRNGRPDAGEVVWAWVPFQEDPTRGKDRPLLIIAPHDAQHVLALKLTSRSHDRERDYLAIGSGTWDARGRPSWVDIDQVYRVHRSGIRREAGALPRDAFDRVAHVLTARYGWMPVA